MLDSKLKPWLLEVNYGPSMSIPSALDKKIKSNVISDAFELIAFCKEEQKKKLQKSYCSNYGVIKKEEEGYMNVEYFENRYY